MLQLVTNTYDYTIATHDTKMLFLVWKHEIVPEALQVIRDVTPALFIANQGRKLFVFVFTIREVEQPGDEALIAISDWLNDAGEHWNASAVVHLDTGFRGMLVKTVTYAIAKSTKYEIPHEPFFSYRAALRWFCDDWPDGGLVFEEALADTEELLAAVHKEQAEYRLGKKNGA